MKIRHREDYRKLRRQAYPDVGEQLDAIYKLAVALKVNGMTVPNEAETWMEKIAEVKNTYRKPGT